MSWAVVRGEPTAAQRYMDQLLDAVRGGRPPTDVSVAELLLHCMRQTPDELFMINGATGERFSKADMLSLAVPAARALRARCGGVAPGQSGQPVRALAAVRSHPRAVGAYLGALLAAVPLVNVDPNCSEYEFGQYLAAAEPAVVFCSDELKGSFQRGLAALGWAERTLLVAVDSKDFDHFVAGHDDDFHSYVVPQTGPDDVILLLPTSGSTGLPKIAFWTNRGTMAQIPVPWIHLSPFPSRPGRLVLVLATSQWATFTMMLLGAAALRHAVLATPLRLTYEHVRHIIHTYKPTLTLITPSFVKGLMEICEPKHLVSFETVHLLGSQVTSDVYAAVMEKLPPTCNICEGYGMVEVQGYAIMADPKGPPRATGKVVNIIECKLVKENGEEAGVDEEGQLYIKTIAMVKGYLKNDTLQKNLTEDGWLPTGDTFVKDKDGNVYFRGRVNFSFKYMTQWVSPEEVERVAAAVRGVLHLVVCCSRRGPAAAIVLRNGASAQQVVRDIHAIVDSSLSDHKRLRGGVFILREDKLPRTHSGKVNRKKVEQLIESLIDKRVTA